MTDRMNIVEEIREHDRRLDLSVERIMALAPRCSIHGTHFVYGVGIGDEFFSFGKEGGCPECFGTRRREETPT